MDDELLTQSRRAWLAVEGLHVVGYFTPEPQEAYAALGLTGHDGYFASRSAAMGAVSPAVTVATFYVFAPRAVHASLPRVWSLATPEDVVRARYAGVAAALRRVVGDPDVAEAVELARVACTGLTAHGRPLFAGHAAVSWPDEPLMQLWHAATLLREHRGDGHVNELLHAGLGPLESLALNGVAAGSTEFMRRRRGWTDEEWAQARAALVHRGLLSDGHELTDRGRALVEALETRTDRAALEGWEQLGADGCRRLAELVAPLRDAVLSLPEAPPWLARRS